MSYMSLSSQEKPLLQKKFLDGTCFSYFRTHPTTRLLKNIWGTNAWAVSPPQILGDCPLSLFAIKCDGLCIWNDLRTDSRNISNIVLFQKTILAGLNYQNKIVL